jgi:hypothetical protein
MNNLFFGVLCTFLGAAIGGIITISSPKVQKNITNSLIAVTGGIVAVWAGYGMGKWQTKRELTEQSADTSQNVQGSSETSQLPVFRITYPHKEVESKDNIGGSFEKLLEEDEERIWLYIYDESVYLPYKIRSVDRIHNQWQVENIPFGQSNSKDDGKNYDIQVIFANKEASSELFSGKDKGLRQLPENIERISDKVTVKRKVFF